MHVSREALMEITVRSIFNRMDSNRDGSVDRAEAKTFVEAAGVTSHVDSAVGTFMDSFDPGRTGRVSWDQFASRAGALIPGTAAGADMRSAANDLLRKVDTNHDGAMDRQEIQSSVKKD